MISLSIFDKDFNSDAALQAVKDFFHHTGQTPITKDTFQEENLHWIDSVIRGELDELEEGKLEGDIGNVIEELVDIVYFYYHAMHIFKNTETDVSAYMDEIVGSSFFDAAAWLECQGVEVDMNKAFEAKHKNNMKKFHQSKANTLAGLEYYRDVDFFYDKEPIQAQAEKVEATGLFCLYQDIAGVRRVLKPMGFQKIQPKQFLTFIK